MMGEKNLQTTQMEVNEKELPIGWKYTHLKDISDVFLGKTPAKDEYCSIGKYKIMKFRDLKSGYIDFENTKDGFVIDNPKVLSSLKSLHKNDVLITSAAHSGDNIGKKSAIVEDIPSRFQEVYFTGELLNIRVDNNETLAKWAYCYFLSKDGFKEIQNAVAGVHLTSGRAQWMRLPIAPLNEQHRIVAKLEKLLSKVDASKERLGKIPTILKRFRQSVLAAACSGRLTADWREKNPDVERAIELLKRIQKGRENTKSKIIQMDSNDLPEIPETWCWEKLFNLAHIRGGVTKGRKLRNKNTILLSYLRVANVQDGFLDLSEIKQIKALAEDLEKYRLKNGDILFTEGGDRDKLGRGTVWRDEIKDCIHQNHIFRARLFCSEMDPDYISLATKSDYAKTYFFKNASQTVNLASMNLTTLGNVSLAIPPQEERQEIVRRVEALFKVADQIEERYKKAKAYVDKLTQSILAKAFRGELVPQDPNDEPASVLLERIREERSKNQVHPQRKKTGARKQGRRQTQKQLRMDI